MGNRARNQELPEHRKYRSWLKIGWDCRITVAVEIWSSVEGEIKADVALLLREVWPIPLIC
jgi:hypothetical protein